MDKEIKKFINLPLSDEEWEEVLNYQAIPNKDKLAMLDRWRSFMFQMWTQNPKIRNNYETMRKKGW